MIKNAEIVMVVNTVVESRKAIQDSYAIRRASLQHRVLLYTTIAGARAACAGLKEAGELRAYAVQNLHKRLAA
jgi:carbamoyl-phosphate synthase large subunit